MKMTNKEMKDQSFKEAMESLKRKNEQRVTEMALQMIPALEGRKNLESQGNDSEDFIEISVWTLKEALVKAYELGKGWY